MKRLISLLALVTLCHVLNAQTYPRLTVIGNDSLCVITMPQVRLMNETFVKLDEAKSKLSELTKINDNYKLAIKSLNRQLELESQSNSNLLFQISNLNEKSDLNEVRYNKMRRKYITISGISIGIGLTCLLLAL